MFPAVDNQKNLILLLKWVGYYRISSSGPGEATTRDAGEQSCSSFPSWSQGWSPCRGSGGAAELQRLSPACSKYNPVPAASISKGSSVGTSSSRLNSQIPLAEFSLQAESVSLGSSSPQGKARASPRPKPEAPLNLC